MKLEAFYQLEKLIEEQLNEYRKLKSFLNVKEAAEFLGVSKKTVLRWISKGELFAIKIGREYRIPKASIIEFVKSKSNF